MKLSKLSKAVAFALAASTALNVFAGEVSKEVTYDLDATSDQIQILNLSGKMNVIPSKDGDVHVRGKVVAYDKSDRKAQALLDEVKFDFIERGGKDVLTLVYPVDDYDGFVYNPERKSGWNSNSTTKYMNKRVKISSKASRRGDWADVYADLTIELPVGQDSLVLVKKGRIDAENLNNELVLDTSSGKINIKNSKGGLVADSGSGRIIVDNFAGDVNADTGSGGIDLINIDGSIDADTGSGGIEIDSVSGRVIADTGSGSVKINDYLGGDLLKVDTGSGSVRVSGDLSKLNDLEIDTGSGSVVLTSTQAPSLELDIDTGSGGITVDLPNLKVKRDKRGVFEGTAGSGRGKAEIDTGSGGVRFRMDKSYQEEPKATVETIAPVSRSLAENKELAKRIRAALNKDADIRKANLSVTTKGDKAVIEGTLESIWDIGKAIKIASEVDGVAGVQADLNVED